MGKFIPLNSPDKARPHHRALLKVRHAL